MAEECTVVRFSREPSLANIENLKQQGESPDKFSENGRFGVLSAVCIALSIITYVLDLILACILLYFYSVKGYGLYFALTLTFVILPALVMTTVSLRWYIVDHDDPSVGRRSVYHWILRIIFLILQLSQLLRYVDTLVFGIRSKIAAATDNDTKQAILYRRMLDEDSNSALLRLFHCFLHSAPQAILQLVILLIQITHPERESMGINVAVIQAWTVLVALMSVAWALTSYHRSVRFARDDKDKIKWAGLLVAFCWQLMSALSRVLALSLLASSFPAWMGCAIALHWAVMSLWLALGQQALCSGGRCEELLFSAALGLAYVFAFISPRDGPTRYSYLAYYLVCFMENTAALVVWCVANNSNDNPFLYYGAAGGQVMAFLLAIAFLFIYYQYCHPSRRANCSKIPSLDSDVNELTSATTTTTAITNANSAINDRAGYSKSFNVRTRS